MEHVARAGSVLSYGRCGYSVYRSLDRTIAFHMIYDFQVLSGRYGESKCDSDTEDTSLDTCYIRLAALSASGELSGQQ